MVGNTVHATFTETYDINTIQNELSILAVHTPQSSTLKKFFHGFYEQYSKMKVLGCNFQMACASKQDLDPTLVGFEAGQIDPRDVMNPILFKACTGEGINALLDQIYNAAEQTAAAVGSLGHSIDQHIDSTQNAIKAYYSLLADGSFRQSHPQRGITVMGLKPMVHKVVTTQPFKFAVDTNFPRITGKDSIPSPSTSANTVRGFGSQSGSSNDSSDPVNASVFVSNGVTEMPWLDTAYSVAAQYDTAEGTSDSFKTYLLQQNIPRVYMGALVLPPSSGAQNLYFRITVVWHILFKDFRFAQDLSPVGAVGTNQTSNLDLPQNNSLAEGNGYFNMYHTATKLAKDYGSFDTQGVESVECVMEKGN